MIIINSRINKSIFGEKTSSKREFFDFFNNKIGSSINATNFSQYFFPIIALFAEDCHYNIYDLYSEGGKLFVQGMYNNKRNQLMLRYGNFNELVVARIEFIEQRKGKMSKLFKYLIEIQDTYELNKIVIESVVSDSMENWCRKNSLQESPYHKKSYEYIRKI